MSALRAIACATRALACAMVLVPALACTTEKAPVSKRAPSADSARTATAEVAQAAETNEWTRAEVVKRLNEAGLVVSDSNRSVHHVGITVPGFLLDVSDSPLEVYLFPTAAARAQGTQALDTMPPAVPNAKRPRYIVSGNLIAIHVSPRDVLAERVENVLTARHEAAP